MEEKVINNSISDNEIHEQKGRETTVSNEREKKITRFVKIVRLGLLATSIIMLVYFWLEYEFEITEIIQKDLLLLFWFLVILIITILSYFFKKKLPLLVARELDKDMAHHLKTIRVCLVVISIFVFLDFLEKATSGYGIDSSEEEYVIWYYVIWAITLLMFVFKKKLPSLVERVINLVKESIKNRKESKKK